ncbi:MAG: hypothetical protein ACD_46C00200G0002 [uncultured bacterium]|nr:MAG: hypothetical protein ACD_46C00200G0002 [uncultured bacterium]
MSSYNKSFRTILAWCLYDWAAASFSIIVTTFVFATYFTAKIAENNIVGTFQWANGMSLAGIIIALTSPIFGAIADHAGFHKRWLFVFTLICMISSALLWFAYPDTSFIYFTLACVVIGTIGFEIALVFYNAYLPYIATTNYLGRISGIGWGFGYFGGIVALLVALLLFVKGNHPWLDHQTAAQIRICGPFVTVWFFIFSIPLFLSRDQIETPTQPLPQAVKAGIKELMITLKKLPSEKNMLLYLFSHMIYTDGLNTLFAFGGIYAAGTFGLSFEEILMLGITMNVAAGIGAVLLAWMDDLLGSKETVMVSLISLTIFGIPVLFVHDKYLFWTLAALLCVFVGPVQSASRSLMVRLILTKDTSTEMFGLYALSGRITAFIGPWILGMATLYFNSQRVGMATILVFFALGALTLIPVHVEKSEDKISA